MGYWQGSELTQLHLIYQPDCYSKNMKPGIDTVDTIRRECLIEFREDSKKSSTLLDFLLKHTNTLRVTRSSWISLWPLRLFKLGGDRDPLFQKQQALLVNSFLGVEKNNHKYNDIEQGNQLFQHHFYALTKEVISRLKQEGPFFQSSQDAFYGFEDPAFYKDDFLFAAVITHERLAILYLTEKERDYLATDGVFAHFTADTSEGCLLPQ